MRSEKRGCPAGGGLFARLGGSRGTTTRDAQFGLRGICCLSVRLGLAAGLSRFQREPLVVGSAKVTGTDGVTAGLIKELLVQRRTRWGRCGGAIGYTSPPLVSSHCPYEAALGFSRSGFGHRPVTLFRVWLAARPDVQAFAVAAA